MTGTIYCLENHLTDKLYIGQTTEFERRMQKYATGHCHKGALRNAILKYGWQHFSVKIVEEIPVEDLDEAERFWIAFLDTMAPNGYNLREGGDGGKMSETTKELMREANLRRVEEGTHNFLTDNPGTENNRQRMEDGTHNFLTDNPSHRRMEEGTHNFLTDNPLKNPETVAKRERSRRTNRPTLDWVDMLEENPDET